MDASPTSHPDVAEAESKSLRIFVVENHPDTLKSLRTYLESLGHSVISARTVAEALEKLPASDLDMLISDIGLPDGTGWELLRLAQLSPDVFAIAMSGFGMNADSERSNAAGFRHHLLKPFSLEEFDGILDKAVLAAEGHPRTTRAVASLPAQKV